MFKRGQCSCNVCLILILDLSIRRMSSTNLGKCPLCFKVLLLKNFKRHCEHCHDSVNTKEKYEKLFFKMKQSINSEHQHTPPSSSTIEWT